MARRLEPDRLERIDGWMAEHVASGHLAGLSVQICQGGAPLFTRHHGMADREASRPVAEDTIWRIKSMTKPVTCLGALMLYEEGAFLLNQPVADFIPAFADLKVWAGDNAPLRKTEALGRPVTIHDLLTHQAGLGYGDEGGNVVEQAYLGAGMELNRAGDTMARAVARLCELPLMSQPGTRWVYGLSTDVLGHLIEVISGQGLGAFLKDRIFEPLAMVDTGFGVAPAKQNRLAVLYGPGERRAARLRHQDRPLNGSQLTMESGGAGLFSTLPDYQRFADVLARGGACEGGHLISPKTHELMVRNHLEGEADTTGQAQFGPDALRGVGYGLGISVMLNPARARTIGSAGDYGWSGGASTSFLISPAEDLTMILMTQLVPLGRYPLRDQLRVLTLQALLD